ncbi:1-phosphofructokinase family hexose kinase [Ferroacidibacillus organovorans]|uniref:Tagatose-6-phosphate kinase n=1 Tax=Ferroacidibacillus organovorans TaxID=1765683 RepID=A0A101XPU1_9BACL|nr:1-phosphofructokinase family hexose kinase [Ferroacidibacillus organovorans]KUO95350.1 hypothetical protein ATW55_10860 [Ferroacidibacillus organovorans]
MKPYVLTVTANPALDKTYFIEAFRQGEVHRVRRVMKAPGGKGINVLRVLHTLLVNACGTGFLGGETGEWIAAELTRMGIRHDFYRIADETRTTVNVVETGLSDGARRNSELLEPGPTVIEDLSLFFEQLEAHLSKAEHVVMSGSLAPGLPTDFYAQVIQRTARRGGKSYVDTRGEAMVEAIKARPHLVKMNQVEFEELLDARMRDRKDFHDGLETLCEKGCDAAIVTCGANGYYARAEDGSVWEGLTPALVAVNPVGSGDAFFAGLVASLSRDEGFVEALRLAGACGASNALRAQVAEVAYDEVMKFRACLKIEKVR